MDLTGLLRNYFQDVSSPEDEVWKLCDVRTKRFRLWFRKVWAVYSETQGTYSASPPSHFFLAPASLHSGYLRTNLRSN